MNKTMVISCVNYVSSCGVDLYAVQQLLGHSSTKMTQRYVHFRPGHLKEAIDRMENNNFLSNGFVYNKGSSDERNGTDMAHLSVFG